MCAFILRPEDAKAERAGGNADVSISPKLSSLSRRPRRMFFLLLESDPPGLAWAKIALMCGYAGIALTLFIGTALAEKAARDAVAPDPVAVTYRVDRFATRPARRGGPTKTVAGEVLLDAPDLLIVRDRFGAMLPLKRTVIASTERADPGTFITTPDEFAANVRSRFGESADAWIEGPFVVTGTAPAVFQRRCLRLATGLAADLGGVWEIDAPRDRLTGVPDRLQFRVAMLPIDVAGWDAEDRGEWASIAEALPKTRPVSEWRTRFFGGWLSLTEPPFPLAILAFATEGEMRAYVRRELGHEAPHASAFYAATSNRVYVVAPQNARTARDIDVNLLHEVGHQLAFNRGLMGRLTDVPLWLSEGVAMLTEQPGPRGQLTGFDRVGRNPSRLRDFRRTPVESYPLADLITAEKRPRFTGFRRAEYALSWSLTYFLYRQKRAELDRYVAGIASLPLGVEYGKEARLADFEAAFGLIREVEREWRAFLR